MLVKNHTVLKAPGNSETGADSFTLRTVRVMMLAFAQDLAGTWGDTGMPSPGLW